MHLHFSGASNFVRNVALHSWRSLGISLLLTFQNDEECVGAGSLDGVYLKLL